MSSLKNRRRRLNLVIEKDLQIEFALKLTLFSGGLFLTVSLPIIFFLRTHYELLMENALLQAPEIASNLRRDFRMASIGIIFFSLFSSFMIFLIGLSLSRKIAGPLKAFKSRLKDLSEGKTPPFLKLRSSDYLHDLQALFNSAVYSLAKNSKQEYEWIESIEKKSQNVLDAETMIKILDLKKSIQKRLQKLD